MDGDGSTVKLLPLLFTPLANTTTFPVVAPDGTLVPIAVALQLVTLAVVPLNLTVPLPCVEPKFEPLTVTGTPTAPEFGERLEMLGAGTTVKDSPLLSTPLACTTTFPLVAPEGTFVTMELALQLVIDAVVPLNLTVLLPWKPNSWFVPNGAPVALLRQCENRLRVNVFTPGALRGTFPFTDVTVTTRENPNGKQNCSPETR